MSYTTRETLEQVGLLHPYSGSDSEPLAEAAARARYDYWRGLVMSLKYDYFAYLPAGLLERRVGEAREAGRVVKRVPGFAGGGYLIEREKPPIVKMIP